MKEKQVVLVIDDEPKILGLLQSYLEAGGYTALCAASGKEGRDLFEQHEVSLVLLDLMLPDCCGEQMCKSIRQVSDVPVIMITAKVDEASIIRGLNIGADDYVCKPFSPRQLMARIQAALRRSTGGFSGSQIFTFRDLSVDTDNRIARRGGQALNLTRDEYNILALLMSRQAKIFTRDEILYAIKGVDYDGFDRSVDTHIKKLRAKIADNPKTPVYIETVYGMGYRLCSGEGA